MCLHCTPEIILQHDAPIRTMLGPKAVQRSGNWVGMEHAPKKGYPYLSPLGQFHCPGTTTHRLVCTRSSGAIGYMRRIRGATCRTQNKLPQPASQF